MELPSWLADRYQITEVLEEGPTRDVARARPVGDGRPVRVERIHPPGESFAATRALTEAQAYARLNHPALEHVLEADRDGDALVLVVEEQESRGLVDYLKEEGLLRGAADLGFLHLYAEALEALHEAGLVHRGVRPEAMRLARGDRPFLSRPAWELLLAPDELLLAVDESGRAPFHAPEMLARGDFGKAADWYGFAAVGWWSLTGEPPFTGRQLWDHAVRGRWPLPDGGVRPEGGAGKLLSVLERGLDPDPGARPQGAGALRGSSEPEPGPEPGAGEEPREAPTLEAGLAEALMALREQALAGRPGHPVAGGSWGASLSLALAALFVIVGMLAWWMSP